MKLSGFTLLELSIVLVIIGLIIGGVMVGQEMIKQAEIRNIQNAVQNYQTAVNTFKLKYNALPGDFVRAKSYWPDPLCTDDGANTCNGNGDGNIWGSGAAGEDMRAWEHLSLSGIVPSNLTGKLSGGSREVPGVNIPVSPRGGYRIAASTLYTKIVNSVRIVNGLANGGILEVSEAQGIDVKIDDGLASSGKFLAWDSPTNANLCVNGDVSVVSTASYILASAGRVCRIGNAL
jgi:prepilin-type N-terminal cleavage/methylation domain-containing protein